MTDDMTSILNMVLSLFFKYHLAITMKVKQVIKKPVFIFTLFWDSTSSILRFYEKFGFMPKKIYMHWLSMGNGNVYLMTSMMLQLLPLLLGLLHYFLFVFSLKQWSFNFRSSIQFILYRLKFEIPKLFLKLATKRQGAPLFF